MSSDLIDDFLAKMEEEGGSCCAQRIAPFRFKVPKEVAIFLTRRIVVTLLPTSILKQEGRDAEGLFVAIFSDDNWLKFLDEIMCLRDSKQVRRLQRLATGYSSQGFCIYGVINLLRFGSVVEKALEVGTLHDGTMCLSVEERCVRMLLSSPVNRGQV